MEKLNELEVLEKAVQDWSSAENMDSGTIEEMGMCFGLCHYIQINYGVSIYSYESGYLPVLEELLEDLYQSTGKVSISYYGDFAARVDFLQKTIKVLKDRNKKETT